MRNIYKSNLENIKELELLLNEQYEYIIDTVDEESFEEKAALRSLKQLITNIEDYINTIHYFSQNYIEGYLELTNQEKFELDGNMLTSGTQIEVFYSVFDSWEVGEVAFKDNAYYFKGIGEPNLYDGMKIRMRKY